MPLLALVLLAGCHPQPLTSALPPPAVSQAQFEEVSAQAGLHYKWVIPGPRPLNILQTIGSGCAFLDYDNDGNLDVLLIGPKLVLYKGDGKGHFTDVTHAMGLDKFHGHFLGCAVGDCDNDGYDDVYVSGYRTGLLLHNENGRGFKDVTQAAGLRPQPWGTSCAWGDVDGDGKLDLYVGNYVDFGPDAKQLCLETVKGGTTRLLTSCGPEQYKPLKGVLYHNDGAGRFRDVTKEWGADSVTGKALAVAFCDYTGTGRQGLYVANDRMPGDLLNNLGGSYLNDGVRSGTAVAASDGSRAGMGVDWGDFDNDGRQDLTIADFTGEQKCILVNDGSGAFEEHSHGLGLAAPAEPFLSFGVKWFDYDNDGWLDLMFADGHVMDNVKTVRGDPYRQTTLLFHNDAGKHFTDMSAQAGPALQKPIVGRGLAVGDFDNDGHVDALVVDAEGPPLLLHNESKSTGHWLSFTLIGDGVRCNRDGYGAQVVVTAGGLTQTRVCHADGSYLSSSDKRVHVGLGKAARAGRVSVHWPDGRVDAYLDVAGDRGYVVREGHKTLDTRPARPL